MSSQRWLVGIDEAGRGPLAGPVAVAAVVWLARSHLAKELARCKLGHLRDSKHLSSARREEWYAWLRREAAGGRLAFSVSLVGEKTIDRLGINQAVAIALRRVISRLKLKPRSCRILLDGGLRAPKEFTRQKTITRGDTLIPIIMLASIVAKVRRDRRLARLGRRYPAYGLEIHKGYGTKAHYAALRRHGLLPLHRRSFLKNLK